MTDAAQQDDEETLKVGETVHVPIRRDHNFAFLAGDSVSVVQSNNAVELAVISHRIGLDHQLVEVIQNEGGGLGGRGGPIMSGPDIVHVGSVRISTAGLLELIGLSIEHLRLVKFDEVKIKEKLTALGF